MLAPIFPRDVIYLGGNGTRAGERANDHVYPLLVDPDRGAFAVAKLDGVLVDRAWAIERSTAA